MQTKTKRREATRRSVPKRESLGRVIERYGQKSNNRRFAFDCEPLPDWMETMTLGEFERMRSESERRR